MRDILRSMGGQELIGLFVTVALIIAATWVVMSEARRKQPAQVYCSEQATATVPRCPPKAGSKVMALWPGGDTATVFWTGKEWQLYVPGPLRYRSVPAPHHWEELQ